MAFSYSVNVLSKSWLPGVGYDLSGNAKQGKIRVVGQIAITTADAAITNTIPFSKFGLSGIDTAHLALVRLNGSTPLSATSSIVAADVTTSATGLTIAHILTSTGAATAIASTSTVTFDIVGDAITAPELGRIGAA